MLRARFVLLQANNQPAQQELEAALTRTDPFKAYVAAYLMHMDEKVRLHTYIYR